MRGFYPGVEINFNDLIVSETRIIRIFMEIRVKI